MKKYNSVEAINMLLKGKKMCILGHNHNRGYYYDLSYPLGYEKSKIDPRVVIHNGDGSIYKDNENILDNFLFISDKRLSLSLKKRWIIARPKDFDLKEFPITRGYKK